MPEFHEPERTPRENDWFVDPLFREVLLVFLLPCGCAAAFMVFLLFLLLGR